LAEKGVKYREVPLQEDKTPDLKAIAEALQKEVKLVFIQRSRGYQLRPALSTTQLKEICAVIKAHSPSTIIMVDNCYGEFTETLEPPQVGAHLIAGSLIKNPGGGLALNGGYIAGRKELIEQVAWHLTAPGLGKKLGATLFNRRYYYMGLFLAPHAVQQSLMGAALAAWLADFHGYETCPGWKDLRSDIVQAICLSGPEQVHLYCQTVQRYSPVDSHVSLEYGSMPGYESKIIMAAGTFIQGSSLELSCDAPLREPYNVFLQGGLTYQHCRYVMEKLLEAEVL
jgi:cystathionine beta-lyase family protein involved in aluminum resistance